MHLFLAVKSIEWIKWISDIHFIEWSRDTYQISWLPKYLFLWGAVTNHQFLALVNQCFSQTPDCTRWSTNVMNLGFVQIDDTVSILPKTGAKFALFWKCCVFPSSPSPICGTSPTCQHPFVSQIARLYPFAQMFGRKFSCFPLYFLDFRPCSFGSPGAEFVRYRESQFNVWSRMARNSMFDATRS